MNNTQLQILVTIIAGMFSIVSVLIQTNKSSKNKYITGERRNGEKSLKNFAASYQIIKYQRDQLMQFLLILEHD